MTMVSEPGDTTARPTNDPWRGFRGGKWRDDVDVADFVAANVVPYEGDASFLAGPTDRTRALWDRLRELIEAEMQAGVLDVDASTPSDITAHAPGYIDRDRELVVGLQTDAPLKRAIMPRGGLRMVRDGLEAYGFEVDPRVEEIFTRYRKTHNDAVFDTYTPAMRSARRAGVITGLPDAYGRGRIIGDYRRVALYGTDRLVAAKRDDLEATAERYTDEATIRLREEIAEQIAALAELAEMAAGYGLDITRPAATAHEAVQWLYLGYLGAVKDQNGAAMSLGRTADFLDVYVERDVAEGRIDEERAQELIDDFVMKLRIVRFLRTPAYDALFSGDPTWVTEALGGIGLDGRPRVTRTSFRYLQTLRNLGPAPEPNLTVLWSPRLPEGFKRFCAELSIETSALQYESDELLREHFDDDTAIACCVSATRVGKDMQFFGARVNLAKALLYAINGGVDEMSGDQVGPEYPRVEGETLDSEEVLAAYDRMLDWLASQYVQALNTIHYMHDKYCYERLQMALHDSEVRRTLACGIAGLSVVADSLSAIKHVGVRVDRDERGLAVGFTPLGDYPAFGNNDDRADDLAVWVVESFMDKIRAYPAYRDAVHTQSVLTITSNVVYGKHTGSTPDGRVAGEPLAPGANPMHGRDRRGAVASALSVAKLPYSACQDGISLTTTLTPAGLGRSGAERAGNLVGILDGYIDAGGFHMNVNVLDRETLEDAMAHPERYPQLTVRVSGYAVNFVRLTPEQQREVIARTIHEGA